MAERSCVCIVRYGSHYLHMAIELLTVASVTEELDFSFDLS